MSSEPFFPALENWEPTRQTLHWYCLGIGVIPRAHALPHPKWWHISLKVRPEGLVTDPMPLPGGGTFAFRVDLHRHQAVLDTSRGESQSWSLAEGLSSTAFAGQLLAAVADLGLQAEYARNKFENDEPRQYDPAVAEKFFTAVVNADRVLQKHRASLTGPVSPVQLWPHGFDLAFEWFGTRVEEYVEHGETTRYPSQINLGFSPGHAGNPPTPPYFYSNPWPFEKEKLVGHPLPSGAAWFTESWQGSILHYDKLAGDPDAEQKLLDYARALYDLASPTLLV